MESSSSSLAGSDIQVCVVGAGVCGLTTVKCCLEAGLKVTCFERSPHYGGLWNYQDDKSHSGGEPVASVMRTTILNTSKELSAFSDYPMPAHLPNYMKHDLYMDYIKSYVEHFKLEPHLRLGHEIVQITPEFNDATGSLIWCVNVRNKNGDDADSSNPKLFNRKFDKLIMAVGHHNVPYTPKLSDQQKFKGLVLHSAELKDILNDERLIDKRVVIVGIGNSALDAACDLAIVARKCYLSTHRGSWLRSRLTTEGPYDFKYRQRYNYYQSKHLPQSIVERRAKKITETPLNHQLLGLTPKHKVTELFPATNDMLPFRIFSGSVCLKGLLARFTENGVVFEGEEDQEYEADVVILATGYTCDIPFLDEAELGLVKPGSDEHQLYLNIFAPRMTLPSHLSDKVTQADAARSLAYVGFVQPSGSIAVIGELQARLVAQAFIGKISLPALGRMEKWIKKLEKTRSRSIHSRTHDQVVGSWIGYCDMVATELGVKPNMSALFFKDFPLWKRLMFGPSVAYQYRLQGPCRWEKSRDAIMTVTNRMYAGINDGKNDILYKTRRKRLHDDRMAADKKGDGSKN